MATQDRVTFSASVEIRAEMAVVFALVGDLRKKAPLNPNIRVIHVELEGGEPIREGSVFHHRFRRGGKILAYRTRCVQIDPPRLFVSRSETQPPFQVTVTLEPTAEGCRLTQEETLEVTAEMLDALEPNQTLRDGFAWLNLLPGWRRLPDEYRAQQRARLARRFAKELQAWLEAIKIHLEIQPNAGLKWS